MPYLPNTQKSSQKNDLSINEASEFFGVSTKTLRRWEEKGVLRPARTVGGHRRYSLEVLKRFKESKGTKRLKPTVAAIISLLALSSLIYTAARVQPIKDRLSEPFSKLAGYVIDKIYSDRVPEEEL